MPRAQAEYELDVPAIWVSGLLSGLLVCTPKGGIRVGTAAFVPAGALMRTLGINRARPIRTA